MPKGPCEDGWLNYKELCIKFSETKSTWNKAKSECETINSTLLILKDRDLQNFIIILGFNSILILN